MYKRIFSFMFICIFALACIASVSALDVNASDDTFSLDDADFSDLSSNSESLAQNSSASEAESLVGGGANSYVNSLGIDKPRLLSSFYNDNDNPNSSDSNLLNSEFSDESALASNALSSDSPIFIDDSNFDTYFDRQGFISYDVEANSDIVFGNLSNRYIKLDIPLSMSSLEGTAISNSTIELTEDASTSTLRNLNFYANCTSENPDYFTPIYINEADDLRIENNFIYIDYYDGCNYNLAGIYAFGGAENNIIRNNRISIYSRSENNTNKQYIYGIDFSSFSSGAYSRENARGNIISSNTIDIISDYFVNAITLSCALDTKVDNNNLILKGDSFAYGIVAEYFDSGLELIQSNNFTFTKNTIEASSNMVYAIQLFSVYDANISSNTIKSYSNASYGISGYGSYNHIIEDNDITVNGNDISLIGTNFDAIGIGHSGIYYKENSHDILIKNNLILSNYTLGGDYAIKFDSSSINNITVIYNNISSTGLHGDDSVSCEDDVVVHDNNPYSKDSTAVQFTVFDIYVDANGNDNSGNGSSDNPFLTLFKALNYLQALNADSGSNTKVKGIIHIGEGVYTGYGSNLRLVISNLNVELIGTGYNKTIIDGASSHWFFEISEESSVSIKNISLINGVYRQNNVGLIHNKGTLSLENCIFSNSKLPSSSAVVYNDGILSLKNNKFESNGNYYLIYNRGFIDNLFLNLIVDSLNENERILNLNSSKMDLTAYVHDDNGNPISGGYVKFFIEGREILANASLVNGTASIYSYSSLSGIIKISGFYTNSYTNLNVNIGKINKTLISDGVFIYVKTSSIDNSDSSEEDGSLEHPFTSINKAFVVAGTSVESVTIYLLDDSVSEAINSSLIKTTIPITIQGNTNKTHVLTNWIFNTTSSIVLKDLIFDGVSLVKFESDLTIDNCLFTNSPLSAIYSYNGSLTILNSNFTKNNVKNSHHPFYSESGNNVPELILLINDFSDGLNFEKGGAIYNVLSNLTILNSNFIENEAFNGGAIFNNQSDLHISNSNFIGNLAFDGFSEQYNGFCKGGAILQYLGKEVVITDCLFINNTSDGIGGAFYSCGIYPNSNTYDSLIHGALYISRQNETGFYNNANEPVDVEKYNSPQDIYFLNCTFDSNLAPNGGGAVYAVNNSMTSYISCNFLNNMAFTYENLFEGRGSNMGRNWIYLDQLDNIISIIFTPAKNGGAIHDKNLRILDSTFSANTLESGGSVILPTILTYTAERNNLSKSHAGISVVDPIAGGEPVYVSDSSLLTAGDSEFIGIAGWYGTSNGSSIRRFIDENSPSGSGDGSGSGNGQGSGSGSGDGSGSGNGQGSGNGGGSLTWADIISALGGDSNNIAVTGDGSGLADYLRNLINGHSASQSNSSSSSSSDNADSQNSNSSNHNSNSEGSDSSSGDIVVDDEGLNTDVGVSPNPISGQSSPSSSAGGSSGASPGMSSSSPSSSSGKAYIIQKEEIEESITEKSLDSDRIIILILFFGLILFGYYRKSREDEENRG